MAKRRSTYARQAIGGRLLAVIFLAVVCIGTMIAAALSTYTVGIVVDGETIVITTSEQSTDIILNKAGVTLGEHDKLDASNFVVGNDYDKKSKSGNMLIVKRAFNITIIDDGEEVATIPVAGTIADALKEANVEVRSVDRLSCEETDEIVADTTVTIERAFSVDVKADGTTQTIALLEGTVADLLAQLNITLGEDDEVSPSLKTELKAGETVHVYRVTYEEREKTETIKYETIKKTSSNLEKGKTETEQEGKNGQKKVVYKDKLVDGKVVKTTKVSETVVTKAVNEIIVTGTKVVIKNSSSGTISPLSLPSKYTLEDGIPTNAIATYEGSSTAYTGGGTTASGYKAAVGYVAIGPELIANGISYGDELYVVSSDGKKVYGYCIAADCGSSKSTFLVDLYFDTNAECRSWGRRNVTVYVLSK